MTQLMLMLGLPRLVLASAFLRKPHARRAEVGPRARRRGWDILQFVPGAASSPDGGLSGVAPRQDPREDRSAAFAFASFVLDLFPIARLPGRAMRRSSAMSQHVYASQFNNHPASAEGLEGRMLLSGVPLTVSEVAAPGGGGTELKVLGTAGNDQITVKQTAGGLVLGNTGGWTATYAKTYKALWIDAGAGNDSVVLDASVTTGASLFGGAGNDTLVGGSGDDSLYAGAGINNLNGGAGNDVLVSLGSTSDALAGGIGRDSFWTDNNAAEKVADQTRDEIAIGSLHRVSGFLNVAGSTAAAGKASSAALAKVMAARSAAAEPLAETGTHYVSFANKPLFADAGPTEDDVKQGDIGDCYFLAVLSSTAKVDPWRLRESIVDLGDGTYAVQYVKNGKPVDVRVDNQLATFTDGAAPTYAKLGAQNSMWVALMEKAWCYVRSSAKSYDSIDAGWMDETYRALGANPTSVYDAPSAASLLTQVKQQLAAGKSVTYATNAAPAGSSLLDGHAYAVESVIADAKGNLSMRLRNPWGVDGAGNDGQDDGYITVTAQQAIAAFTGIVFATV